MRTRVGSMVFVALVACGGGSGDDYMVITPPGGGGGGGEQFADGGIDGAIVDGGGSAGAISGRVCLAADSRMLTACSGTGAGGLVVTLGSARAVTGEDGSFTIANDGTSVIMRASSGSGGSGSAETIIRDSVVHIGATNQIPAISEALYEVMLSNAGGIVDSPGTGSLMAQIRKAGAPDPQQNLVADTAVSDVFYDGSDDRVWNENVATGALGDAWVPVLTTGTATLTVTSADVRATTTASIQDGAITYVILAGE